MTSALLGEARKQMLMLSEQWLGLCTSTCDNVVVDDSVTGCSTAGGRRKRQTSVTVEMKLIFNNLPYVLFLHNRFFFLSNFSFFLSISIFYTHTHTHTYQAHTHTHIHTYIHMCIHTHIYSIHTHAYIHTYPATYLPTYTHTFIHTQTHTYIPSYIHTYIHTYTHTHTCTHTHRGSDGFCEFCIMPVLFFQSRSTAEYNRRIWGDSIDQIRAQ